MKLGLWATLAALLAAPAAVAQGNGMQGDAPGQMVPNQGMPGQGMMGGDMSGMQGMMGMMQMMQSMGPMMEACTEMMQQMAHHQPDHVAPPAAHDAEPAPKGG
jgi:hypothetical protein